MIEGKYEDIVRCSAEYSRIVQSFNTETVCVKYNAILGVYDFYFVEPYYHYERKKIIHS